MWRKLPGQSKCQILRRARHCSRPVHKKKSVCTFEMPNSKSCTSLFDKFRRVRQRNCCFRGVVYPRADPDAITITQKDLKILKPFEFLYDTVIDFYINKLAEAVAGGLAAFERVKKRTKKVNVFEKDFICIPVN